MPLVPFATQSRPARWSNERLWNYFFVPTPAGPNAGAMLGRPGLLASHDVGSAVRAMVSMGGYLYGVAGGTVWKLASSPVNVGTVPDDEFTSLAVADDGLCIVAGGAYHVYDGLSVTQYATGQVETPVAVATIDGYAVVIGADTTRADRIATSNPSNSTAFDGLDFATAEAVPDGAVGIIRDHAELKVFGEETTETFYNSGGTFPFSRNISAFMERGALAGNMIDKSDNAVFWVGNDRKVYRAFGGGPQIISTPEINEWLSEHEILGAFCFEMRGHKFFAVRTGAGTLAYCIPTELWSEFTTGADHGPWIVTCACAHGDTWYFGTSSGSICVASGWEDDGEVVRAEAFSTPLTQQWVQVNEFTVSFDTGFGSLGRDRVANLQWSRDGQAWSAPRERSLGDTGEYRRATKWAALGRHRDFWQARVWVTDPVQRDIYGAAIR